MAEEIDDDNLAKKIEELAFTFRRKGLVADMDEALEKAKEIILGNSENVPFMGGHDPAVELLFNNQSLAQPEHESSHDLHLAEQAKQPEPKSYVIEQAADKVENVCGIQTSQADEEPKPMIVAEAEEKPTPLEELDPSIREILIEMDHEIVEEKVHHPPIIMNAPVEESNIMRDFHLLDNYFEEEEGKDINR